MIVPKGPGMRQLIFGVGLVLFLSLGTSAYEFPPGLVAWLHTRQNDTKMLSVNMTSGGRMSFDQWGIKFRLISPGLTEDKGTLSFEALDYPGYFLKYSWAVDDEHTVALKSRDDATDLENFSQHATFAVRKDKWLKSWYAFETIDKPGHYLSRSTKDGLTLLGYNAMFPETIGSRVWRLTEDLFATIGYTIRDYGRYDIVERESEAPEIYSLVSRGHSFRFRSPGLTGDVGSTSMESLRYPGFFIQHHEEKVYLRPWSSVLQKELFYRDATFLIDHLKTYGRLKKDYITFEPVNMRGHYLTRTVSAKIALEWNNANIGRQLVKVNEIAVIAESMPTLGWGYNRQDSNIFQTVLQRGDEPRFRALTPGLSAQAGSISFESLKQPGYFVRHHSNKVFVENIDGARRKSTFDEDATFYIERSFWSPGCLTFRPINDPNKFVKNNNQRIEISHYDGTLVFQRDSCFLLQ